MNRLLFYACVAMLIIALNLSTTYELYFKAQKKVMLLRREEERVRELQHIEMPKVSQQNSKPVDNEPDYVF